MKIGRYINNGVAEYFAAWQDRMVPWQAIAGLSRGSALSTAIQNSATKSAATVEMQNTLPQIEDWFHDHQSDVEEIASSLPNHLEPPVSPRNIICVGLNYHDHAVESKMDLPSRPLLFAKTVNTVTGHGHSVVLPAGSSQTDYEAELAVVIGRVCLRVKAARALEYVAGYTCANDVSARDFQFADGQWFRGKSSDTFCPIGPWLVTPNEISDPHNLRICLRLNGQTMQDSNTNCLIFKIPDLIEYVSASITLLPGDIICTGTPPGVGFARKPPVYIQPGDQMEVEIDSIGVLKNRVRAPAV